MIEVDSQNMVISRTPDALTDSLTKWMNSCAPFVAYTNRIFCRDCCCKKHWVFENNFTEFKTVSFNVLFVCLTFVMSRMCSDCDIGMACRTGC